MCVCFVVQFHGHTYLYQALPRFLTLFFEFADRWTPRQSAAQSRKEVEEELNSTGLNQRRKEHHNATDPGYQIFHLACAVAARCHQYQLITALPQIISRFGHQNDHATEMIRWFIARTFEMYPQQTLWMMGPPVLLSAKDRGRSSGGDRDRDRDRDRDGDQQMTSAERARWKKYHSYLPQPKNEQSLHASLIKQGIV